MRRSERSDDMPVGKQNQVRRDFIGEALAAVAAGQEAIKGGALRDRYTQKMDAATASSKRLPASTTTTSLPAQSGGGGTEGDLDWLIGKESGGKTNAKNPKSTAFGLGQLLKANRENYGRQLGIDPNTVDYEQQKAMMKLYVKERYGTPTKAKAFWLEHGWY